MKQKLKHLFIHTTTKETATSLQSTCIATSKYKRARLTALL